jgi:two-component system nitrogen regulation sensor histidine kinase GlnL
MLMVTDYEVTSPLSHFDSAELVDALATGVVILDATLFVVYANVAAQDLLGMGLNQARGRPIGELFIGAHALTSILRRSLERSEICSGHELVLTPLAHSQRKSTAVTVDVTATPLEGQITGRHVLLELYDARQRQRISREHDLINSVDSSRLMVRQLAHEIKNPLGGLRGAAQLLDRELNDGSLKEYTSIIINEADRLRALVDTMLGPSSPPAKRPGNVHEICEHVLHLLRIEAGPGVTVERDYDPSLPVGEFDRNEIIQALLNVARNALQAVEGHGHIILRTRALSNVSIGAHRHRLVATIEVEDDGPGVPVELQKTLFYPLVTGKADGTGLGLTVAQEMMARHQGIVEFESRPGRTLFKLQLPIEGTE